MKWRMPKFLSGFITGFTVMFIIMHLLAALTPVPSDSSLKTGYCDRAEINRDNIRIKMNEARLAIGLEQTADSLLLEDYAKLRADELGPTPSVLSHETKYRQFNEWAFSQGYDLHGWKVVGGEILVTSYQTTCGAIDAFLGSPTHKDILLDPATDYVGIGFNGTTIVIITGVSK